MTRKDFDAVPFRKDWKEEILCDCLVILPQRRLHDSGYRCMDFVACKGNEAICRLSGCSDVMHFDGIGGYGHKWLDKYHTVPSLTPPIDWNIDCLPKSGLLRIFCHGDILCGMAMSSFEFYYMKRPKAKE